MTARDPGLTTDQRADAEGQQRLVAWVRSHWALRMTIGVVAILLPLLVVAVVGLLENGLLTSISDAYHHRYANSVFVGGMCAFASFLWAYDYKRDEDVWGNRAALAALGVAVFSTTPPLRVLQADHVRPDLHPDVTTAAPSTLDTVSGFVHFGSAAFFFIALARFCRIWELDEEADGHAALYRWSRRAIHLGLAGAVVVAGVERLVPVLIPPPSVTAALVLRLAATAFLLLEVLMVEAFGLSWLVRGSVEPAAALRAVLGASVPLLLVVAMYTVDQVVALERPHPAWMAWVAGALGVVGVALALLSLRHKLPTFGLRLARS